MLSMFSMRQMNHAVYWNPSVLYSMNRLSRLAGEFSADVLRSSRDNAIVADIGSADTFNPDYIVAARSATSERHP